MFTHLYYLCVQVSARAFKQWRISRLLVFGRGVYSSIIPPPWWWWGGNQRVLGPGKKINEKKKKWKGWGKRREKFQWVQLFYSILG